MATVVVTKSNLESIIKNSPLVVLDFWAAWCGPCRTFAPIFDRASEEHKDYVFGKVDTEAEREIAGYFGIQAIPTLIIFRDGIGVYQESGSLPPRALDEVLQAAKALDMNEVRAELERESQKPADADDTPWELQED